MNSPKTKSRLSVPTSVKGMQRTPRNRSEMARFSRNTFVIVRIRLFCTSVRMTSEFPITANRKITAYSGICTLPMASQLAVLLPVEVVVNVVVAAVDPPPIKIEEDEDEEVAEWRSAASAVIARIMLIDTLCANESEAAAKNGVAEEEE